jgi:hypothetical protein
MVRVIDDGRSVAVGPAESPVASDDGAPLGPTYRAVIRPAREVQVV